jgi:lysophospholipase L1-like esterase
LAIVLILSLCFIPSVFASGTEEYADSQYIAANLNASKRVMVYGDSNVYGWYPVLEFPSHRYPATERWPGVLQQLLGSDVYVIEEGFPGRTTDIADVNSVFPFCENEDFSGASDLPAAVGSHVPLDVVVIMLGTNDVKPYLNRSAFRTAIGAGILIDIVNNSAGGIAVGTAAPKVLLLAPPPLGEGIADSPTMGGLYTPGGLEKSQQLGPLYKKIAEAGGADFIDLGELVKTDGPDSVHFTRETHRKIAEMVAEKLEQMLD